MNTEYCIKCGGKAEFSVSKPKFCPSCGSPFNRTGSSVSKSSRREEEDFDDGGFDSIDINSLRKKNFFKAEVAASSRITIGDLPPPAAGMGRLQRSAPPSEAGLSEADIIRKIQSECGPVRSSQTIGE